MAEYFIFRFMNDYLNGEERAVKMLEDNDFYIVPVANPDGEFATMTRELSNIQPLVANSPLPRGIGIQQNEAPRRPTPTD